MLILSTTDFSLIPSSKRSTIVGPYGQTTDKGFTVYRWLGLLVMVPDADFTDTVVNAIRQEATGLTDAATFESRLREGIEQEVSRRTEELTRSNDALNDCWKEVQAQSNALYGDNVKLRQAFVALTGRDVQLDQSASN